MGQYCYIHIFAVISRFPLKTVHPFRNFLAVLPPPTLYGVENSEKIFWIHASNIACGVWGAGEGWTCVKWKTPQKCSIHELTTGVKEAKSLFCPKTHPAQQRFELKRKGRGQVPQLLCLTIIVTYFMFNFYLQHPPHTPSTPSPTDSISGGNPCIWRSLSQHPASHKDTIRVIQNL